MDSIDTGFVLAGPEKKAVNPENIIKDFADLVNKSAEDKTNLELRNIVAKVEKNLDGKKRYLIKMFLLNTNTGMMINSDGAPNISFRVDTINNIFDSLCDTMKSLQISEDKISEAFYNAGYRCGRDFGAEFNKWINEHMDINAVNDKISEWCVFDSSVGWGALTFDAANNSISVQNNFQIKKGKNDEFPQNCSFFKGYICGVLEKLYGKKSVKLECDIDKCEKEAGAEKKCSFKISLA